jgi:hypothetical protein
MTFRIGKNGRTRTTIRNKVGRTTYTTTYGGGKKTRSTMTTRSGNYTISRSR